MPPYRSPMRTLLALAFIALGCGAEAPSGPSVASDAGSDATPSGDARPCPSLSQAYVDGHCVSATDSNCNGRACPSGQNCFVGGDDQGRVTVTCMAF